MSALQQPFLPVASTPSHGVGSYLGPTGWRECPGLSERDVAHHVKNKLRGQHRAKHELKPLARAFLQRSLDAQYAASQPGQQRVPLPQEALDILAAGDQAVSTANQYAPYVDKWSQWCSRRGVPDFPPDAWNVVVWLFECAAGDTSVSPTLNRCNALSWGCTQMGQSPIGQHSLVLRAKRGLHAQLGLRSIQKAPILPEHVSRIYLQHAANENVAPITLLDVTQVAVMVEAAARHDDMCSVSLGSVCCFEGAVRLFCPQTKTDRYRDGQWLTLVTSEAPDSAVQLLWRVINRLVRLWDSFPREIKMSLLGSSPQTDPNHATAFLDEVSLACQLHPVTFNGTSVDFPRLGFSGLRSSGEFSKILKGWAVELGLDPTRFASHSCKIGSIQGANEAGIPDRLIIKMGRWRSNNMLGHYIGEARSTRELVAHLNEKWFRSTKVVPR